MKWNSHIKEITRKGNRRLWHLRQCRKAHLPTEVGLATYCTKIRPLLEYAAPVWGGSPHGQTAHRTGRKISNRPRHIILKFFSRPLKNEVLRSAKRNKSILSGIYFLDDLTKEDFDLKQRARPLMAAAYKEGSKVAFRAGRLIINGTVTPIPT